jgi:hypothetical protein
MNFHRWEFGFVLPKIEIWLYLHSSSIPSVTAARAIRKVWPLRDYGMPLIAMKVSMARLRRDNARRS